MQTSRRRFIKVAGGGILGWGILPALPGVSWSGVKRPGGVFSFPRSSPEAQGVSSKAISQFLAAANASGISWHSFMLLRHGHVVAEGWWKPYEQQYVHSLYSLSKSFTSTAIGLLVKEGKLDTHSKVVSFFPHDLPAEPGEHLQQMTVRSLLTMNTGHAKDTLPFMRASKESWVRTYLAQPVEYEPGSHFLYNTGNTYMLGAILHQITGETLEQYLTPRFFQPLGISGYDWEVSPQGLNTAGYGLRVKTEDVAKLGQLYLQKGSWKGEPLLTEKWVEEATSYQTASQVNNGDWSQGYGYQFWRCTHGFYRGDGAFGQFCIVMPELDAVMAVTGQSPDMQQSMNIIWDHIPGGMQAQALPEDAAARAQLKKDLAGLGLPVVKGATKSTVSPSVRGKTYHMEKNDLGVLALHFDLTDGGCRVAAGNDKEGVLMDFGWGKWMVSDKRQHYILGSKDMFPMPSRIAGTAAWVDDRTLQLNVRMVEGIFGDRITCVFDGDMVTVRFLNSVAETAKAKTDDMRKELRGMRRVGGL
ncbi:MAG TPA: serine hydrolase [Puia sp.]|jgi:CubicO group peptidase (beta-lactamase class C family)